MRFAAPAAIALVLASAAAAQSAPPGPTPNSLASSRVFPFNQMTAKTSPNGAIGRNVFTGTLATGEAIAVHETVQPAGATPNQPHRIQHSEVIVVQQGTVEFFHDGKTERAGPGGVIYVAFGTLHTLKNVGDGPAQYVVIQIGGDTKK